jgi:phage-related protein
LNEYTDAAPQDGNDIYLMASNVEEWAQSSRLQPRRKYANYNFDTYINQKMQIYNGGDLPAHFILEIDITGKPVKELKLKLEDKYITIDLSKLPDGMLKIDTKKRLVTLTY